MHLLGRLWGGAITTTAHMGTAERRCSSVRIGLLDHPLIFSCAKASWPRHAKAFKKRQLILLWLVTCFKAVLTTHRLRYWTESRRRLKPLRWRNPMGSPGITSEVCWRTVVGMMLPFGC